MTDIQDYDRDAIHVLPLALIPFKTQALDKTRMVKNARLESVIEIFTDQKAGSGHVRLDGLSKVFPDIDYADQLMIGKLGGLHSYDVYSLRILLRKMGIPVDRAQLQLSQTKQDELRQHMQVFTRPLIAYVYGDEKVMDDYSDLVGLFRDPDVRRARANLEILATKLGTGIETLPKFLEDYGDIFLSLSYYRHHLFDIKPALDDFRASVEEIMENHTLQGNRQVMKACGDSRDTIDGLTKTLGARFKSYQQGSRHMWREFDATNFRRFRNMVQDSHTVMGGVLCALNLKMSSWKERFPNPDAGGPMKRAEFIMTELQQGLDRVRGPGFQPGKNGLNFHEGASTPAPPKENTIKGTERSWGT